MKPMKKRWLFKAVLAMTLNLATFGVAQADPQEVQVLPNYYVLDAVKQGDVIAFGKSVSLPCESDIGIRYERAFFSKMSNFYVLVADSLCNGDPLSIEIPKGSRYRIEEVKSGWYTLTFNAIALDENQSPSSITLESVAGVASSRGPDLIWEVRKAYDWAFWFETTRK